MKKYTDTHEWVEVKEESALVGISRFAAKELGDIVFVELPNVGQSLNAGDVASVLESTKAASDVYSPLSGTVTAVNEELKNAPEKISASPEDAGWLYKIHVKDKEELTKLLEESAYEKMVTGK